MTGQVVTVRPLDRGLRHAAADLVARGMRDNPLHRAAYGPDPERRVRQQAVLVGGLLTVSPDLRLLGAFRDGALVAVGGAAPPGTCRLRGARRARMLPTLARLGPAAAARVLAWTGTWAGHDPDEAHVHLGPVAVDAGLRRQGLGGALLRAHCADLDRAGRAGYLETDTEENVAFYERFGYRVVGGARVIGVPCWFMRRAPQGTGSAAPRATP
ncbi:GNAT family N-acetyltransferase [Puerhibacterium sp. TATVAM-FAB25]|uniref:GNAT family N-acetyltransferase n=1 Tax=Puerhibacterium sp. TATVAM-FAB25 TaxID=3093699 RepID=UPI003978250F